MEPLEPALLQIRLNLLADNGGLPGAILTNDQASLYSSFFVEIQVGDFRPNAVGVIGLNLDFAWDGLILDAINFNPTLNITSQFPLLQGGSLTYDGLIDDLSGGSLPEFEFGQAIGINQLDTFALLHFYAESLGTTDLTTTVNEASFADDYAFSEVSLDVETDQFVQVLEFYRRYNFTYYYGNGDLYSGYVYEMEGTYTVGQELGGYTNETGNSGYYKIDSIGETTLDSSLNRRTYLTSYYDGDTGFGTTSNVYNYGGYDGLGSEYGYAYDSNYFSADPYFRNDNEADLTSHNVYFEFTYYYGDGDYYSGAGYASQDYINAPGIYSALNSSRDNDTGHLGYYEVHSIQNIYDLGLRNTSTYLWVYHYYDAQTDLDGIGIGGYGQANIAYSDNGYNGLGSEEGYAYNAGFESGDNLFNHLNSADINTEKTYLFIRNPDDNWWVQSLFEGNEGDSTAYTFEVVRQGRLDSSLTVNWAIEGAGLTQVDANDFVNGLLPTGTVFFAPGESVASFTVLVRGDNTLETAEGFQARISNPDPNIITLTTDSVRSQIFNDDGLDAGWAFGDPHLVTLDGLGYDFMAVGEFVLLETQSDAVNSFQVQVRYEPYPRSEIVSIATRMAIRLGERKIELTLGENPLLVDGFSVLIDPLVGGLDIDGDGQLDIQQDKENPNRYSIILNSLGEQVQVNVYDTFMDVNVVVSQGREGTVRGLLGNGDGDPSNDLMGRDGTLYAQPIAFSDLYGAFANSWRVDAIGTGNGKDSLFSYPDGQNVGSFDRSDFPRGSLDLSQVPADLLAMVETAVDAAGITDPLLRQAAIYDYFLTGDADFLESATNASALLKQEGTLDVNSSPVLGSVGVTAEQVSVVEGENGSSKTLAFRFWRTDSREALTINYRLEGSLTAEDLSPSTSFSGSLNLAEGVSEQLLTVTLLGDSLIEADERLTVAIANESLDSAIIAAGQAVTNIVNDDFSPVTIDVISGNDVLNRTEKAAGVAITGTATGLIQVRVIVANQSKTVTVGDNGSWSANFAEQELPGDGLFTVEALGIDASGNETSLSTRSLLLDTTPPNPTVINPVTDDNRISSDEKSNSITVTGTAEDNSQVRLAFGEVTRTVMAIGGQWSMIIAPSEIPDDGLVSLTATATDAAGNTSAIAVRPITIGSNSAPTDLSLSSTNINENVATNSIVGIFSTTDANTGDSFTYSLVAGEGATDNTAFSIVGNQLQINHSPNFETKNRYSIRVTTTDAGGLTLEKVLTLTVNDLNERPTRLTFNNTLTQLEENTKIDQELKVADLFVEDDALGTNNFFLTGRDKDRFLIRDLALFYVASSPNFEAQNSYEVTVNVDDSTVGVTPDLTQTFTLKITDVNEAPTAVILTNITQVIAENTDTSQGIKVADIQITDDALGTNSLSLLGSNQSSFEIRGQELFFIGRADFEAQTLYNLTIAVTDTTLKPALNATPDATVDFSLAITNLPDQPVTSQTLTFKNTGNGQGALVLDFSNLPGTIQVKADEEGLKQTGAFFNNVVGLYKIADDNGAVFDTLDVDGDGNVTELIQPGQSGYARTALSQAVNNFILRASGEGGNSSTTAREFGDVLLEGGQRYAPFVIANGGNLGGSLKDSIQAFLAKNPDNVAATLENFMSHEVAYFSFGAANPDGSEHLRDRGNNIFGFEDLPRNLSGISDNDFNDGILAFTFVG